METIKINQKFAFVIFGASGDLAKLKLFPALYSLVKQKRFTKDFYIIGFARTPKTRKEFQEEIAASIKKNFPPPIDPKFLKKLLDKSYYINGQYDNKNDFIKLKEYISEISGEKNITTLAYFSVPPVTFKPIIKNLGETKTSPDEDLRLILEKPFGLDTKSAQELFHFVARYFSEDSIYLLDHYLGKAAVQSILNLRHSNRLLNLMMKGPEVSNIQISAFEKIGVENRVSYFNEVGMINDMVQSHLLQILAMITMSIPITENAESIHREKYNILSALRFVPSAKNILLGQYENYKEEKGIPKNSKTETFAALRLFIDRESWYKTPIYIRTGKKLNKKHTYVVIEFKKFEFQSKKEEPNRLIIELQPDETITIQLVNKQIIKSGYQTVNTSDSITCNDEHCLPEHGILLLDILRKRKIFFLNFPEIIASWQLIDSIKKFIKKNRQKLENYKNFSEGPESQKNITAIDNNKWYELDS